MQPSQTTASSPQTAYTRRRDRYVDGLIKAGSAVALPEFTRDSWSNALYRVRDRQGVGVVVVSSSDLSERQRHALQRFEFAQYLAVGFIDRDIVFRERLEHEPSGSTERPTVHCVAFSSQNGSVLATVALRGTTPAAGKTLRSRERPLLPLERRFGWGPLNRLRLLPDLPLERIREIGSFAKNQRLGRYSELALRGAVEVCLGMVRALTGALRLEVDAVVGEFEDAVARKNLEFLHTPMVVVRGGLPTVDPNHHHLPGLEGHARYPFAVLVSDMGSMAARLAAVETALSQPGQRALRALLALKDVASRATSSLAPEGGLPRLANTPLPQRELRVVERRPARARGDHLRSFAPLAGLPETETTTLCTLLEEARVEPEETVIRRGDPPGGLYLIEEGVAEVRRGRALPPITLGRGDYFGEIALLAGTARSADVIARSQLKLLYLDGTVYRAYLAGIDEVQRELARVALSRATAHLQPEPR
jgi:CRP-like cAMP-binding protein